MGSYPFVATVIFLIILDFIFKFPFCKLCEMTLLNLPCVLQISLMQIMIDNYIQIFENDNKYCIHMDKSSDGLKTSADFINSSGKSTTMNEIIGGHNRKTCCNDKI